MKLLPKETPVLDPLRPLRGDTLAIVGFDETTMGEAPWDDEDMEIWICNRLGLQPAIKRWDRHFDPHPLEFSATMHETENWETYKVFLEKDHGDKLIYLPSEDLRYATVPNIVQFPKDAVVKEVGREYFASVIGWQIGLALHFNHVYGSPKRLELYGVDLRAKSEYAFQRPNAEFLLGLWLGRGLELKLPEGAALLNQDGRTVLYGFELYSGFMGEMEAAFHKRAKVLKAAMDGLKVEQEKLARQALTIDGQWKELIGWLERVSGYRRGGKLY